MLYIDQAHTECLDAIPTSDAINGRLGHASKQDPVNTNLANFHVKMRLREIEGHPPTIRFEDETPVVSSNGFIFHEGRQIFLHCQDYSKPRYEVYFVDEATGT